MNILPILTNTVLSPIRHELKAITVNPSIFIKESNKICLSAIYILWIICEIKVPNGTVVVTFQIRNISAINLFSNIEFICKHRCKPLRVIYSKLNGN